MGEARWMPGDRLVAAAVIVVVVVEAVVTADGQVQVVERRI